MKISILPDRIRIRDLGDYETLKVKMLPGREYNDEAGAWDIPIAPGLAASFDVTFPDMPSITAVLEEREREFMDQFRPPKRVTMADLQTISAAEAIERAANGKLMNTYGGDLDRYYKTYGGWNK